MFFLSQGANIQSKSSKETNPMQKFDKNEVFPTPMMKIPTKSTKLSKTLSKDQNQWKEFIITLEMLMEWKPFKLIGFWCKK